MTFFSKYTWKTIWNWFPKSIPKEIIRNFAVSALSYWLLISLTIIWVMDKPAPRDWERNAKDLNWHNQAPYSYRNLSSRQYFAQRCTDLRDKEKTKLKSLYFLEELLRATNGNCIWTSLKDSTESIWGICPENYWRSPLVKKPLAAVVNSGNREFWSKRKTFHFIHIYSVWIFVRHLDYLKKS